MALTIVLGLESNVPVLATWDIRSSNRRETEEQAGGYSCRERRVASLLPVVTATEQRARFPLVAPHGKLLHRLLALEHLLGSNMVQRFLTMMRQRHAEQLDTWLEDCLVSTIPDLQTFAEGSKRAYTALKAALTYFYSNGPVEGQINKLNYIKRRMYGIEKFELLRQRFLQAA